MSSNNSVKLAFSIFFLILLAVDIMMGGVFLHVVGDVLFLPNRNYLYVFAILPAIFFIVIQLFKTRIPFVLQLSLSSILIFGGVIYLVAAGIQLWKAFIVPFGLLTLVMGVFMLKTGVTLFKKNSYKPKIKTTVFIVSTMAFFALSTIYMQPWQLVMNMPNIDNIKFNNLDFSGLHLHQIKFINMDLQESDFSKATLAGVEFFKVNLSQANFKEAKIKNVKFLTSSLVETDFMKARVSANFESSVITKADFTGAHIFGAYFNHSDLRGSKIIPRFIGRTYIKNSLLCNVEFNDLQGGVYGWSGSIINKASIPKGTDSCCGEFDVIITENQSCEIKE